MKYLRALLLCLLFSFLVVSCMQARDADPDIQEGSVNLSSYKDKQPLVLFFWTTWCPFCRSELRTLSEKYPEIEKENGELFAVNVGESAEKIKSFIRSYPINLKFIMDRDGRLAGAYNILGVPTYIIINKQGSVVFQGHYFPQGKFKQLISK